MRCRLPKKNPARLFALGLLLIAAAPARAAELPRIVCIECHGSMTGRLGEPVRLWQSSIHAENGIACNNCHGGDPQDVVNAMSPARGFLGVPKEARIPDFCGRCHVGVLKDYRGSAHGRALGRGGPTCVTCHGNHAVTKASLELINEKSCSRCHSFQRARVIRAAMEETEKLIVAVDGRISAYKERGADMDRLEKALFSQRNRFHNLFHSVDVDRVRQESAELRVELRKTEHELKKMDDEMGMRRQAGIIAIMAALAVAGLLHLLRRTFR